MVQAGGLKASINCSEARSKGLCGASQGAAMLPAMHMKAMMAEPMVTQERVKENQMSLSKKALIGVSSAADRPRNTANPRSG